MIDSSVIEAIADEIKIGCNQSGAGDFITNVEITMHSSNSRGSSVKFSFPLYVPPVSEE